LTLRETEGAIKFIKDEFQRALAKELNLSRISAPLIVLKKGGMNDYLSGTERPVGFKIKGLGSEDAEVVQSLAKWKRAALADYGFAKGEGLYTDMNAIRPDETLDNLHSLYVDQWDWERVMRPSQRNLVFLKNIIRKIYKVILRTEKIACKKYKKLPPSFLPKNIFFIHSEDLCRMFPISSPRAREDAICKRYGAVFIIGIGAKLADGRPHDLRAPDYDDWSTPTGNGRRGLNGDILVWNPVLNSAFELSSMGIRVDRKALLRQIAGKGRLNKKRESYHRRLLRGELPQTIGGGIGQSRLCMLYLRKRHIGEVQASIWPERMRRECKKRGIHLL